MEWFILAITSALLSATAAISQKKVLFDIGALEFSFLIAIFNLLFSLPFFLAVDFSAVSELSLIFLYIKTILGAMAFWCVMLAIKNMEISGALPLMVLTPGLVAIFAFMLLGEALSNFEIGGMLMLLAGTYILERKGNDLLQPFKIFWNSKNHHYIIFALLLFTATNILDKWLLRDFKLEPSAFMGFQQLFLLINFSIMILLFGMNPINLISNLDKKLWRWIIFISVITVGYRYTQIEAVKIAPVALVLAMKRTSVFFATVIGGKIFKEHHLIRKAIATIIMIIGAILLIYF